MWLPEVVTTDNGPQFTSFAFKEFLRCQGIEHRPTSLYNPQCNGGKERFNWNMQEGIYASLAEGKSFPEAVRTTLCNYCATKHVLTGLSPAELTIGRKRVLPLENLKPPQSISVQENAKCIAAKQETSKSYVDTRYKAKLPESDVGHSVRVKKPLRGHKLKPVLSDPLKVMKRIGPSTFQLQDGTKWNACRLVHAKVPVSSPNNNHFIDDVPIVIQPNLNLPLMTQDLSSPLPDQQQYTSCATVARPQRERHLPTRLRDYELNFYLKYC